MVVVIHQTNSLSAIYTSPMHYDVLKHYWSTTNDYQNNVINADLTQTQSKNCKNLAKPYATSGWSRRTATRPKLDQEATNMVFAPTPFKVKLTNIKALWVYSHWYLDFWPVFAIPFENPWICHCLTIIWPIVSWYKWTLRKKDGSQGDVKNIALIRSALKIYSDRPPPLWKS